MRTIATIAGILLCLTATATGAQTTPSYDGPIKPFEPYWLIKHQFNQAVVRLHDQAVALRDADGGVLSAEHSQQLHQKLVTLHTNYQRRLSDNDPYSVGSDR